MSFKRINNITGWLVFIIASAVYIMTMEATGSFWDCGEFASSAYKLQIPHPPGAPLFVLIGRLFMAPFDPSHAATGINLMSALASGFTILFLFWSITHFARKMVNKDGLELSNDKVFGIMAAGVVGALAYTFSDSFWYSAVEGEVYALSSFFTAVVFWSMLKWEQNVDAEEAHGIRGHFTRADRWIILIFFLMGLSIGVHLLNLLTIPAIVMIYYFKRYKASLSGTFFAFLLGCGITGLVQKAMIQWTIKGAGFFDILFVNDFHLPFFVGFAFFFVFIAALIFFGLRIAQKQNWNFLKLGLWSFAFMVMGCFSSYFTTLVRSNANPSVDMYNVDNPVSLVGYLSREQYGDWPVLYGQDFTADVLRDDTGYPDFKQEGTLYVKGKNKYEVGGQKQSYQYNDADMHFFPRMWDQSNDQGHADYYASWMQLPRDKNGEFVRDNQGRLLREDGDIAKPTMAENIGFFMSYQVGWMYLRYFMWNFAGKQNDLQGVYMGNVRDGNWQSGISFLDKARLGDQSKLPDSLKNNKANNKLFFLPLILGLLGIFYQLIKDKKDGLVVGLLFFFTGFAIVLYLNQAGNQPRERDYAYVGSFYAFAIWIGLGVLYIKELMAGFIKNAMTSTGLAAAVCILAVPVLMASQEWDDHDRSQKVLARDLAKDYLESCDKNAILVTFGDNDTYPLWYAQEVEGIRKDIRVINQSLLGTDWYINQLRYKVNESAPTDVILSAEQIQGSNRDQIVFNQRSGMADKTLDLYSLIKDYIGSTDKSRTLEGRDGNPINAYPTQKVSIPVDTALVRKNGTVNADDSILSSIEFTIPKNYLFKNDLAILSIIAGNKWQRPIYFSSPYDQLGFGNFLRMDGLTYRFVPIENEDVNKSWVVDKLMNKFVFGNCDKPGVYYDEENRRHLISIRQTYAIAAINLADAGKKEEAKKMLNKCDTMMLESNFPYGMVSRNQQHNQITRIMLIAAYKAGDAVLAAKVTKSLKRDLTQQLDYYSNLSDNQQNNLGLDINSAQRMLSELPQIEAQFKNPSPMPTQEEMQKMIQNQAAPTPAKKDSPKK
ncbi:MAG: DUF2723 domain-containing protein [Chitinophagaceae bacterium]